jgi:hypothetical protein
MGVYFPRAARSGPGGPGATVDGSLVSVFGYRRVGPLVTNRQP